MKTSERQKQSPIARSRGRRLPILSRHVDMLAASNNEPTSVVIDSQRHGNCTSESFGTRAHIGRLSGVAIRNDPTNNIASDSHANILTNVFGAKLRAIKGYPGGNDITLALERGEVQGRCN